MSEKKPWETAGEDIKVEYDAWYRGWVFTFPDGDQVIFPFRIAKLMKGAKEWTEMVGKDGNSIYFKVDKRGY